MNVYPHHPLYHIPSLKTKKEFFCGAKIVKGPEAPECPEALLG